MSMVMFIIGCVAVMVGAVMVAFGIPVSEFSFGNTLIVSGTTLASGGLIVITVSAVVSQLHRIAEALAGRVPAVHPAEAFETPVEPPRAAASRIPFPPKPAAMPAPAPAVFREPRHEAAPQPTDLDAEEQSFAPTLRNPDAPPMTVEDDVSLSPQYGMGAMGAMGAPALDEGGEPAPPSAMDSGEHESRHEPSFDAGWRSAPPPAPPREPAGSYFDSMWPAKPRTTTAPAAERSGGVMPDRMPDLPPHEPETVTRTPASEPPPRNVAVLKSGVVDGMGYTLYVDGSIEAELPQGTLRFASIDELRSHLEKTS
jgi:hypothetical protein